MTCEGRKYIQDIQGPGWPLQWSWDWRDGALSVAQQKTITTDNRCVFSLLSLSIPFCMTNINKCKHTLPHSLCAPYSGSISIINLLPPADNKDKTTMEPRLSHHIVRTSLCNVTRPPHETIYRCSGVSSTQD